MVALCIGVEQLVGLVQLLDNQKQMVSRLGWLTCVLVGATCRIGTAAGQSQADGE